MGIKHTPGPWVVGMSSDNGIHCIDAIDPKDGKRFEVCEVWGIDHDKTECEISKANARLISSAPDLLEALEDLMEAVKDHYAAGGYEWKQARAAIAKAKGEGQ